MLGFLRNTWALMLGVWLLMLGNGLQGTLLGVRGEIEGFSTFALSVVMAGYFVGFLGGSKLTPEMIRRVGHVRVFAALASFISAILILLPVLTNPIAWVILRIGIGFCFSGVYVVAESWLNNSATNETRGISLSFYLVMQMLGIAGAQVILAFGNPEGFMLFIVASVLVSISFAPILLDVSPTPAFAMAKPMSFRQLYIASPLGCVSILFLGGVFSALFGMSSIYAIAMGFTLKQIAAFVAMIYVGGLVFQFPIGWLSDHFDRRVIIILLSAFGGIISFGAAFLDADYLYILVVAFFIGGASNPLYGLIIAYTNDFLDYEDMPAAAGGLLFINGLGAILGPIIAGQLMNYFGPGGFFFFLAMMMVAIATYGLYRSTQRPAPTAAESATYVPISPSSTPVVIDAAVEVAIETAQSEERKNNACGAQKS